MTYNLRPALCQTYKAVKEALIDVKFSFSNASKEKKPAQDL